MSERSSYPVLKNAVILQIMQEVDIPLTEAELIEPHRCKERIREVFVKLLCLSWGISEKSLSSLPSRIAAKQSALDHPDLYADALPEAKFFCLLSTLMRTCGYHDFGFRDLAAPQARRLKRQLSALINFLKYREDMGHLRSLALEEREEVFAVLDEVTENHMKLREDLERARAAHHERSIEREEAESEVKEMEAELASQNKIQASMRQETYLMKKAANELKDKIANMSIALRELQAEERALSREVVDSPDRIKFDLAEATKDLERIRETIRTKEGERKEAERKVQNTVAGTEALEDAIAAMEEMGSALGGYDSASEELDGARERLDGLESDVESRRAERESEGGRLRAAEKRKADTLSILGRSLDAARRSLDDASARLGAVEDERAETAARIDEASRRVDEIRAAIDGERRRTDDEVSRRVASFRRFEDEFWRREGGALVGTSQA